jgi:hypothetical protein
MNPLLYKRRGGTRRQDVNGDQTKQKQKQKNSI